MNYEAQRLRGGSAQRAAGYALTLWLAITLNFLLPRVMPGNPLALIAGDAVRQMGAERIAELRAAYGLDESLLIQYGRYLGRLLHGDLGYSYRFSGGRSVAEVLAERFAWTLLLVVAGVLLATICGTLLGIWAAWRHGGAGDFGLLTVLFSLRSMPPFWLATIFIAVFAIRWPLLPVGDAYSFPRRDGLANVVDIARHAVLPVSVLVLAYLPTVFALVRSVALAEVNAGYVRAARARGLAEWQVMYGHVLPNVLIPLVTAIGLDFGQLLGGVLLIETVFNYRGLGSMMFEAVKSRDYPLLQGGFLLFTVGVLIINLFTDWLYIRLDARVDRGTDLDGVAKDSPAYRA